jgi:hypothetical protein
VLRQYSIIYIHLSSTQVSRSEKNVMSGMKRGIIDGSNPYQRRSVVRFQDSLDAVIEDSGSSSANDSSNYEDAIDIEAPVVRQSRTSYNPSLVMGMEDIELAATSDEDQLEKDNVQAYKDDIKSNQNDDSSHSTEQIPVNLTASWIDYLYRRLLTVLVATGGNMLTAVIAFICPSNNREIGEDGLTAIASLANEDKAFLFVGSDGGTSFISYVLLAILYITLQKPITYLILFACT